MKEIEDKISEWEASKKQWEEEGSYVSASEANYFIKGLKLALEIIKRPSNTQMQIDTKNCCSIYHDKRRYKLGYDKFCRMCGQSLSD